MFAALMIRDRQEHLIDLIATIATGRLCPVITASKSAEETEKRIGSVLLSGTPIVSLDNRTHDLGGELLWQRLNGRSSRSESWPLRDADCEGRTAVYATGNNITFKGDMVRRGGAASSAISRR